MRFHRAATHHEHLRAADNITERRRIGAGHPDLRAALYDALANLDAQVWMTGADPAAFGDIVGRAQVFEVRSGAVEPHR